MRQNKFLYVTKVLPTSFDKARILVPDIFEDFRGQYIQLFDVYDFKNTVGEDLEFVQDDVSISRKDVLRGFHGDYETWKLISVLHGSVYNVIVDNNTDSETFGKWEGFVLSAQNHHQLLIPPGFGNAMLALENNSVYHYKQTSHFVPFSQFTLKWDNISGLTWPCSNPILSQRDSSGNYVKQ